MRGGDLHHEGSPIVLTASRAEMSDFDLNPFLAFYNTFPHRLTRRSVQGFFSANPGEDGQERFAPYGLRKVEALLAAEFGQENVAVAHPDTLGRFIGPRTRFLGISTMDPLGLAYVSTTYNSLIGFGGDSMNAEEFRYLLSLPAISQHRDHLKIVVGGQGAWQIREGGEQEALGIDHLFCGEAEADLVDVVRGLLAGESLPATIRARRPDQQRILSSPIRNAASYGMVEITRGCGRNCVFCGPTMRRRLSLPLDLIMKEVALNVRAGAEMVFCATEDAFLWNCKHRFEPDVEQLVRLYRSIADHPGVKYVQLAHASIAPVLANPKLLEELTPILMPKTRRTPEYSKTYPQPFITVEVGIESGSPRLMEKHMAGKALPFDVKDWPELVVAGIETFNDHGWWPLCTLMSGLPGETEDDLWRTLDLIDALRNSQTLLIPLLFIPLEEAIPSTMLRAGLGKERRVEPGDLTELQWEFIMRCWRHNFEFWLPLRRRWFIQSVLFIGFWLYSRCRFGRAATRPVMRMVGLPEVFLRRPSPNCEPECCRSGPIV